MFDAIVIGSGISGGIAAKELCERGLKTLVIERGRKLEHVTSYTDWMQPWDVPNAGMIAEEELARDYPVQRNMSASLNGASKQFWVKDSEHPYSMQQDKPFYWMRGYHLGGRSLTWGRQSYRLSEMDFEANASDGHGADWPIRYADLAPWYDHVERFIGVAGTREGLPQLPDGEFLPPFGLNDAEARFKALVEARFPGRKVIPGRTANLSKAQPHHEELGRTSCQNRSFCGRGCSYGAYHSSLSSSLPAAERTGNLTIVTDAIVHSIVHDPATGRATGVRVIDANSKLGRTYEARLIFGCASTIGTTQILLNSTSEAFPNGLANSSDMVGRNLMDHPGTGVSFYASDKLWPGRGPQEMTSLIGFRDGPFRATEAAKKIHLSNMSRINQETQKIFKAGKLMKPDELDAQIRDRSARYVQFDCFHEILPQPENRIVPSKTATDAIGIPRPEITYAIDDYVKRGAVHTREVYATAAKVLGGTDVVFNDEFAPNNHITGSTIMGADARDSVVDKDCRTFDHPNLFISSSSTMPTVGTVNVTLTIAALALRMSDTLKKEV